MQAIISSIVSLLAKEKDVYSAMLDISVQKKDVVLKGQMSELDHIVTAEQALLMKIGDIERRRHQTVCELAQYLGRTVESLHINDIVELADQPVADQRCQLRDEFADILKRQIELNDINKKLIEQNLAYVQSMIDFATSSRGNLPIYGAKGDSGEGRRNSSIIDQKV